MITITRGSSEEELDQYWKEVMKYRMEEYVEVWRLKTTGLGFYCRQLNFEKLEDRTKDDDNFLTFLKLAKRPYGNKGVASSIIFNLGWDTQWTMRYHQQPDWVEVVAMKIHELLIKEVEEDLVDEKLDNDAVWTL